MIADDKRREFATRIFLRRETVGQKG